MKYFLSGDNKAIFNEEDNRQKKRRQNEDPNRLPPRLKGSIGTIMDRSNSDEAESAICEIRELRRQLSAIEYRIAVNS